MSQEQMREKKIEYIIKELDKKVAVDFVQEHHYSPVMPRLTSHYLGFHIKDRLVGVLTLGYGTQPKGTANKIFECAVSEYFEIGKMCIHDDLKTNAESMMVSQTVKWIKQNHPNVKFLYTMADGGMGKVGYCYQASNFYYGGCFDTPIFCTPTMEKAHIRSMRQFLFDNNEFLPDSDPRKVKWHDEDGKIVLEEGSTRQHVHLCWPTQEYLDYTGWSWYKVFMYRYALPLNKSARRYLENSTMWTRGGPGVYPKDEDLKFLKREGYHKEDKDGNMVAKTRFVEVPKPEFNLELDNIKVNKRNVEEHKHS